MLTADLLKNMGPDKKRSISKRKRMPSKEKFGDFRDLLNPIKDPQLSFAIDISEVLQNYVKGFREGRVSPNFNSAALLLQGSSNIYGKKVEFLYNLTSKLCACLLKNKQDAPGKDNHKKDNAPKKEKHLKEKGFDDPFFNPEVKRGKNLCCLRQKVKVKDMAAIKKNANKKAQQRNAYVPVDLLPLEGEDKGELFYDTHGEVVGNKKEYILNRCKVTSDGWILLPTVSENLIPAEDAPPDYTYEDIPDYDSGMDDYDSDPDAPIPVSNPGEASSDPDAPMSTPDCRETEIAPDTATPTSTPMDEGYPQSSASTATPDSAPNLQIPSSQGTDEGLGSLPGTPLEGQSPANSDTPMSDLLNGDIASDPIPMDGVEEGLGPDLDEKRP
ncbi:condensin-2 complex subunit H2 [Caerostris darwini]|uniref:Condensin-2 complex subunit H2 n=1 Tax=Caerostris darwini TaxID=1538125 RepID=A0AAV4SFB9_9ARAC|nr:condensin-2 complex subunit H2 [Caerostris darwini]